MVRRGFQLVQTTWLPAWEKYTLNRRSENNTHICLNMCKSSCCSYPTHSCTSTASLTSSLYSRTRRTSSSRGTSTRGDARKAFCTVATCADPEQLSVHRILYLAMLMLRPTWKVYSYYNINESCVHMLL